MHRLFVALRPPRAMREQLLDQMGGVPGARWQDDEQLHVTLRFVGEVDGRTAEDVADALLGVSHPPVAFALDGVGHFDKRSGAALWAGVSPQKPLAQLHRKIDQVLVRAGLPPEGRAYLPHITLARLSRAAGPVDGFLAAQASLTSAMAEVAQFHLYESHLSSEGARYLIAESYRLG